ncbi:MAG: ROK family protein [Bryobacteraceae bacterium]
MQEFSAVPQAEVEDTLAELRGKFAVALDLGGTKLAAALIDVNGRILHKRKQPTERKDAGRSIRQLAAAARQVVDEAGCPWEAIAAAGLDVPGIYFAETGEVWAPNLPGWDRIPLRDMLRGELPVPVVIDSDRAAYVLGEQWLGAARGLSDVVFLAVGTGIGAGILSGGRLIRGTGDIAGSVGWFALDPEWKDIYGRKGCMESEAAGPALARRLGAPSAEKVVLAARKGDKAAAEAVSATASFLAMGIANIISILNPQMIVLGGGLMRAGDLFLEQIRHEALKWAQPISAGQVRIELTELGEDAGLLGAARLALFGAP